MPPIGPYHPQLVHFAIAVTIVGIVFRLVSLTGRMTWTDPAARALLIAAGFIGWVTATSGQQAHGPVERIPGVAPAVQEHEDWGNRARNIMLVLAAIELVGLGFLNKRGAGAFRVVSALVGLGTIAVLYETGEHGGALVYQYGGGPGLRRNDTTDMTRLLVAGLYNRGMADRAAGDKDGAARLIEELARRLPNDNAAKLTVIESTLKDKGDAAGALAALRAFDPGDDRRSRFRKASLMVDAFKATGSIDSARAVLEQLKKDVPQAASRIDEMLKGLTR